MTYKFLKWFHGASAGMMVATPSLEKELLSQESTYRAMLRDIYQMGLVLERKKYRFLGWAYRVFLSGLTLTFIAYIFEQLAGPVM